MNDLNIGSELEDQLHDNKARVFKPVRRFAQVVGILTDVSDTGVFGRCVLWNSGDLEFCFVEDQSPIDAKLNLFPQLQMHHSFQRCALEKLDWKYPDYGSVSIGSVWRHRESVMARLEKVPCDRGAIVARERVLDLKLFS